MLKRVMRLDVLVACFYMHARRVVSRFDAKAQASAKEAFDRLFNLKWTPPGRGLWVMGTPLVNLHKNSAALQNCAFVSTAEMSKNNPAKPFAFLMEASMLGVGVGFDDKGADKDFTIYEPTKSCAIEVIPDTREGCTDPATCTGTFGERDSLDQLRRRRRSSGQS